MPHVSQSCFHNAEVNCDPRSVVIALGTPNEAIHPCVMASMTASVVVFFSGIAVGHRVKRSMIVNRYSYPLDSGIFVRSACR